MMKVKDLLKVAGITAVSVGMFSAAMMGVNHITYAFATSGAMPLASAEAYVNVPQAQQTEGLQFSASLPEDTQALEELEFQAPNLTILESPWQYHHRVPTSAMTPEEAAQIGARYIWDMFGECIDGMYVQMLFSSWQGQTRTYWSGSVGVSPEALDFDSGVHHEMFRFMIDAVTGMRVDITSGFRFVRPPREGTDAFEEALRMREFFASDEVRQKFTRWNEMNTEEKIAFLNLTPECVEPYVQLAKHAAAMQFNTSTIDEASIVMSIIGDRNIADFDINNFGITFAGIYLTVSDDTGREAIIGVHVSGDDITLRVSTQHNDIAPGFSYDRPGVG